jgi:3-(3-hydroxy-phenyl)propionate hydroxylase
MQSVGSDIAGLPVLVVGGGPVGMTAAASLDQQGIPVVIVEAEPETPTDWRASTFHPPTLQLLAELGIAEQLHAEGLTVPKYQFRDRQEGLIAEFDFGVLADDTAFPHRLQLNQQHLVRMWSDRLVDAPGVQVRYGCRALEVANTADGVTVTVQTDAGTEEIAGSFLIGADGANSTVRQCLGIDFAGFTYPMRFQIVSTSVDIRSLLPDIADVNYVADPDEWVFILRTPESWRVVYPVPADSAVDDNTDMDFIQAHLQGVAEYAPGYPVTDFQTYNVHQRVASSFRQGRIVLAGDAAHINSPLGGVGLNSGIHDAVDVTRRIGRVWRGEGTVDDELDTFAYVRRRVAVEYVQADTSRNTERLSERDASVRRARNTEMREIAADPEKAHAWCMRASLLESVRQFGIGLPPDAVRAQLANEPNGAGQASTAQTAGTR